MIPQEMDAVYSRLKPAIADLVNEDFPAAAIVAGLINSAVVGVMTVNDVSIEEARATIIGSLQRCAKLGMDS